MRRRAARLGLLSLLLGGLLVLQPQLAHAAFGAKDDLVDVEMGLAERFNPEENDGIGSSRAFTINVLDAPDHGSAQVTYSSVGHYEGVTYTPDAGYRGQDQFTYVIKKDGSTSTATVHLDVDRFGPEALRDYDRWQRAFLVWTNPRSPDAVRPILAYRAGTAPMTAPDQGTTVPGVEGYEGAAFVNGLTNYTTYTVTYFTEYADGEVVAGDSVEVRPEIEAVRGLRPTPGNGTVKLEWSPPAGADRIIVQWGMTGYQQLPGSATSYTVSGLTNGTREDFYVTAHDLSGEADAPPLGAGFADVSAVPGTRANSAPTATPTSFGYVPGQVFEASLGDVVFDDPDNDLLRVQDWTEPASGLFVECYLLCEYQPDAAAPQTTTSTVSVFDGYGGTASAPITFYPRNVVTNDDSVTSPAGTDVVVDVLANDQGTEADDYVDCFRPKGLDACSPVLHKGTWKLRVRLDTPGTKQFTYRVDTEWGQTADYGTVEVTSTVAGTAPSAPGIGTAVSGAKGGTVNATAKWAAPASNGNSPITGYRVQAQRLDASGKVVSRTTASTKAAARSLTMRLPSGRYKFRVRASNGFGPSPWSASSNIVRAR